VFTCGPYSTYDTRQLGLPLCEGQEHWLVVNITAAILKNQIAADHPIPIYSVFGSRTGFSGSANRIALFPVSPNSIGMRENNARGVIRLVTI